MPNSIRVDDRHNHIYHIDYSTNTNKNKFWVRLFYREYNDGDPKEHIVAALEGHSNFTIFKKFFKFDQQSKRVDLDYYNSIKILENNWREFADKYEQNHRS